jgi:hypothetical protein
MAITWRQHVKNTMSRMGKATHLKDVLKEASKTWSSVKKDAGAVVSAVEGKSKTRRARRTGRKTHKGKKHTRRTKSRKGSRRGRRGGAVMPYDGGARGVAKCASMVN